MTPRKLMAYFKIFRRMDYPLNPVIYLKIIFGLLYVRWSHIRRSSRLRFSPPNLVLLLTSRCNKDCAFCHYEGELNPDQWQKDEMNLSQFTQILEASSAPKVGRICFYGGEPLMNRDLFLMLAEAKKRKFFTSIITNGLMIEKYYRELQQAPLDLMTLSYYPEDLEKIERGLSLLGNSTVINLSFIVSQNRIKQLDEVFAFAEKHSIAMVTIENIRENQASNEKTLYREELNLKELKDKYQSRYGKNILIRWSDFNSKPKSAAKIQCPDFWDTVLVNNKGQTSPCCQYPLGDYSGDLRQTNLSINSSELVELRENMRQNIIPPKCQGCHYLYAKDPLYS